MPDQLVVGVSIRATERLKLLADYQWTNRSLFDRVPIDFSNPAATDQVLIEEFEDTNGIRVGAELGLTPMWRLRRGYIYNEEAAPPETVTPLLPEAERNHITAGVGVDLNPNVTLDASYQYLTQDKRRGRVIGPEPGELPTTALNSGLYRFRAHLVGVTFTLLF